MNIYQALRSRAQADPDQIAFINGANMFNYRQLDELIDSVSGNLYQSGVRPGGRFGVFGCTGLVSLVATVAASRLGATCYVLPSRFASPDIQAFFSQNAIDLVIASDALLNSGIPSDTARLSQSAFLSPNQFTLPALPEHDLARILRVCFSSGSTGEPKGAAWSELATLSNIQSIAHFHPAQAQDRIYIAVGLDLNYGLCYALRAWLFGATLIIPPAAMDGSAGALLYIQQTKATQLVLSASMLAPIHTLLHSNPAALSASLELVKRCIVGGEHVSIAFRREFQRQLGAQLFINYGLSEAGIVATSSPSTLDASKFNQCLLDAAVDVEVVDASGRAVPVGTDGHLIVNKTGVASGYMIHGQLMQDAFSSGRFASGDLARLHANGYLEIRGRPSDLLPLGGDRVNPADIESCIASLPGVTDAVVFLANDASGQPTVLTAQYTAVMDVMPDQVQSHCRGLLPSHWVPQHCSRIERIALSASGKKARSASH